MQFVIGQSIRLSVEIRRTDTQALIDPDALTFTVRHLGTREAESFAWPTDEEVVRDGTGQFHLDYTPGDSGGRAYRWAAEGTVEAAAEGRFMVAPSRVL